MDYNNYSFSFDKKILIDSNDYENITNTNNYDVNKSDILLKSYDLNEVKLLNKKYSELMNKINFVKKNINNNKIIDSLMVNINNLLNVINDSIDQIDEEVINLGSINKKKSIEIEFA